MRNHLLAILAISAATMAAPAEAQLVNGQRGANAPPAPIGTKAPSPPGAIQTQHDAANAAAARRNQRDFRHNNTAPNDAYRNDDRPGRSP